MNALNIRRNAAPLRLGIICASIALSLSGQAGAQSYPARPITFVVPASTGSSMDIMARQIGPVLTKRHGQPVVVENREGASGNIGVMRVVKAPADGYTVLVAANTISTAPWLYKDLEYDPVADLVPVAKLNVTKFGLVVNPAVEAKRTSELVALAKKDPGKLNAASSGALTPQRLLLELFKQTVGVEITHVPYKGVAGAVTGLMSGQVQAMFTTVHSVLPQVGAGTLRVLSIASNKRVPWFPDVPTMAEEGIAGVDTDGWAALFLPARTPADIVRRLSEETLSIIAQTELRETVLKQGVIVDPAGPEELAALLKRDLAKWQKVVARAGIKPE